MAFTISWVLDFVVPITYKKNNVVYLQIKKSHRIDLLPIIGLMSTHPLVSQLSMPWVSG